MTVTQTGGREAVASLEAVAARLRDLSPVTSVVAADVMTFVDDRFASGTDPSGAAWAPLKPATVARRRGTVANALIDTGRLRSSIFGRGERTGLRFGTNVSYAAPHQLGASNGRPPRRAFLPVDSTGSAFSLSTAGLAGAFWTAARERIRRFIRTGEVT